MLKWLQSTVCLLSWRMNISCSFLDQGHVPSHGHNLWIHRIGLSERFTVSLYFPLWQLYFTSLFPSFNNLLPKMSCLGDYEPTSVNWEDAFFSTSSLLKFTPGDTVHYKESIGHFWVNSFMSNKNYLNREDGLVLVFDYLMFLKCQVIFLSWITEYL